MNPLEQLHADQIAGATTLEVADRLYVLLKENINIKLDPMFTKITLYQGFANKIFEPGFKLSHERSKT